MRDSVITRDPWVAAGLALLFLLSVLVVLLYRSAPQSVAEARSRTLVAVRPSAFEPRMVRAEERAQAARAAVTAGDTAAAVREYVVAAEQAWSARELAETDAERSRATTLWADAVLNRAGIMLQAASSPWWRRDDNPVLQEALASVERVQSVPTSPAVRQRADALAAELRAKLRPGPLEWLPRP